MKLNEYINNSFDQSDSMINESSRGVLGQFEQGTKQLDDARQKCADLEQNLKDQYVSAVDNMVSRLTGLEDSVYIHTFEPVDDTDLKAYRLIAKGVLQVIKGMTDKLVDGTYSMSEYLREMKFFNSDKKTRSKILSYIEQYAPDGKKTSDEVYNMFKNSSDVELYDICRTVGTKWNEFCKKGGITWE